MAPTGFSLLCLFSLVFLCISRAQERAPHGSVYENHIAFPPSAYNFFHPNARRTPETKDACAASKCSPSVLPLAAHVEDTVVYEGSVHASASHRGRKLLGGGGVAGIFFGVAFSVLLAFAIEPNA